ncbi:466_t:CDS:2, partial [Scutellospora calospora]
EYLPTDPEGYAIIYNFLESGKGGASYVNCPFFEDPNNGKIQIIKDQRTCGGVKICPYVHNYLQTYKHTK